LVNLKRKTVNWKLQLHTKYEVINMCIQEIKRRANINMPKTGSCSLLHLWLSVKCLNLGRWGGSQNSQEMTRKIVIDDVPCFLTEGVPLLSGLAGQMIGC
jgi:hypothetical protein